ncbi:MAG: Nif3-like dinuclear metal center hexameric protein [Bacteroidota bacterium]
MEAPTFVAPDMKIKDIIQQLEQLAPPSLQENYDNSGLLIGSKDDETSGAIVCLDCTEEVIDEAIASGFHLIISHHPIIFSGLKKINGKNYVERIVIKAIKNNIAIYAIHTNLDNVYEGVNQKIASRLGLINTSILSPKNQLLCKLVTFAPLTGAETIRNALFAAGAGSIGKYSDCSFSSQGMGTFKAGTGAQPYVGSINEKHLEPEERIEVILENHLQNAVIAALKNAHPYEEVAYDVYPLLNSHQLIGSGLIGDLKAPVDTMEFLKSLKKTMLTSCVRYTKVVKDQVSRIAVCGGSGSFLFNDAKASGADVFITADYKYHQFFDADGQLVIADIGHYESEQFTGEILAGFLSNKFPTFAVRLTKVNTNPVNYL